MQARLYWSLATCLAVLLHKSMKNLTVFTNNGIVVEFFETKKANLTVKWISATVTEVLDAAKRAISKGSKLYSSPLAGVKTAPKLTLPFEKQPGNRKISSINPYLSLLVGPPGQAMDFGSARAIDEAMKIHKKSGILRFTNYDDEVNVEFQTADLETLLATIQYAMHVRY